MIEVSLKKQLISAEGTMQLDIDFTLQKGQFLTLRGPSGAGKTSILRMLAGLMEPDQGVIRVEDSVWLDTDKKQNLKPEQRGIGFVFQDYALFPNMTVKKNLEFALKKGQSATIVNELIEVMELKALKDRKPESLSGGQRQRVALARALVARPQLLLLDEPLSALDTEMRHKLQEFLLKVHQKYETTTILVSHDISETYRLSDQVAVLENGRISRQGSPENVFTSQRVSGKFQFHGQVLSIERQDVVYIVLVLVGKELVKVVVDKQEADLLQAGDHVLVASKAFNPIIQKIEP